MYLFLQFTHDEMTSIRKSPSLRWCNLIHQLSPGLVTDLEEGLSDCEFHSSSSQGESLGSEIAQCAAEGGLKDKIAKFLEVVGFNWGKGHLESQLCSFGCQGRLDFAHYIFLTAKGKFWGLGDITMQLWGQDRELCIGITQRSIPPGQGLCIAQLQEERS